MSFGVRRQGGVMYSSYKPVGYSSVSVYIMADEARRVIDFLSAVFDTTPLRGETAPDGSIRHA